MVYQKLIQEYSSELNNKSFKPFPKKGKKVNTSSKQGVYIICNSSKEVLHVGKTSRGKGGLNQRLQNHLYNQSSFSKNYITENRINLRQDCLFKSLEVEDPITRAYLEAYLIGTFCPKHIGTGIKK